MLKDSITGGTPNIPAYYQAREGYRIIREVGVEAIRTQARHQTQILIDGALERGYTVNTPREGPCCCPTPGETIPTN